MATPQRRLPLLGWLILALTAAMSLLWSSHKLLEQDEIFSLQTDRVASLAEVLRIQRFYPISLEPPPYHVLAHAAMKLFGPTAFALRLPALAAYLLMQLCLYFFVRNLVGKQTPLAQRAGLIAMAVPALTWTMFYSAEGRPYGVLLGSYALAVLCWQIAAQRTTNRLLPLIGLAAALALTLNVHFYGVLLLIPICGAELLRSANRRRIDIPMLAAIALGMASLAATLPYVKSSSEFKKHYYAGPVPAHMLTQPYRQMLLDYTTYPRAIQHLLMLLLLLATLGILWRVLHAVKNDELSATAPEWAIVLLLVAMPIFAFILGRAVTHALEVRHSIGAIVGISALIAIAMLPWLQRRNVFRVIMTAMLLGIVALNTLRARASAEDSRRTIANLTLSPTLKAQLDASADRNLYFQDLGEWEVASLYEPDTDLRSRLVLVDSRPEEMQYERHDTMFLTATHTQRFSAQPAVDYDALRKLPGEHTFVVYHSGWDWTADAFRDEEAKTVPIGPAFGGTLLQVRFQ